MRGSRSLAVLNVKTQRPRVRAQGRLFEMPKINSWFLAFLLCFRSLSSVDGRVMESPGRALKVEARLSLSYQRRLSGVACGRAGCPGGDLTQLGSEAAYLSKSPGQAPNPSETLTQMSLPFFPYCLSTLYNSHPPSVLDGTIIPF